ncbi:MAG TPA: tyrosine-type recombinase/integrase [Bryobacteraceae bacterium]
MGSRTSGYGGTNRVNIVKKAKVNGAWNFYPAVIESNGKLKDKIRVRGAIEVHPEGAYYLEWREDKKRIREPVAERTEVLDRARRKRLEIEAALAGLPIASPNGHGSRSISVQQAVEEFLENIKPPQREPRTYTAYKYCLELFASSCKQRFVREVKREDMLAFIRHLYSLGNGPRTANNRAVIIAQMLKANGVVKLLQKHDWPSYVDPIRPVYESDELRALFAACDSEERLLYTTYLLTGFRDKEVRHLAWRDIDFRNQAIRVTAKPHFAFKPKNKEEREVPVPASLLEMLKTHRAKQKSNVFGLVFPTASGQPDKKHENKLKRIAWRAGLNCGSCVSKHGNRCMDGPYCSHWFLHKFRHTFATRNLQDHVCDIRTLQLWLGHKDLASTMVYLKAVRNRDIMERLEQSGLAQFAVT